MNNITEKLYMIYESSDASYDTLISNLDQYNTAVKDYFNKNEDLKFLMDKTKSDPRFGNIVVNGAADLEKAVEIYKDYIKGLSTFMSDIYNCKSTSMITAEYSKRIEDAMVKNNDFIESLFGVSGTVNPGKNLSVKECTNAFLGALTEFSKLVDYLKSLAKEIKGREYTSDVYQKSEKLFYDSVDRFCNRFVTYAIESIDMFVGMGKREDYKAQSDNNYSLV